MYVSRQIYIIILEILFLQCFSFRQYKNATEIVRIDSISVSRILIDN